MGRAPDTIRPIIRQPSFPAHAVWAEWSTVMSSFIKCGFWKIKLVRLWVILSYFLKNQAPLHKSHYGSLNFMQKFRSPASFRLLAFSFPIHASCNWGQVEYISLWPFGSLVDEPELPTGMLRCASFPCSGTRNCAFLICLLLWMVPQEDVWKVVLWTETWPIADRCGLV